jgi:hypothetical protein
MIKVQVRVAVLMLFPGVVFGAPRETVARTQPLDVTPSVEPSGLSATTVSPTLAPKTTTKSAPINLPEMGIVLRLSDQPSTKDAEYRIVPAIVAARAKPIGGFLRFVRRLLKGS